MIDLRVEVRFLWTRVAGPEAGRRSDANTGIEKDDEP